MDINLSYESIVTRCFKGVVFNIVHVLESLRQPIEDGIVTICRAAGTITYPATFVLVAASNPCPCGYWGDPVRRCRCLPGQILQYQKRISGPIMERIDLHIDLPPVQMEKLTNELKSETSKMVKKRVQKARNIQTRRYKKTRFVCNNDLGTREIKEMLSVSSECLKLLRQAVTTLHLSARTYYRTIKIARTIADLEGVKDIGPSHMAEALQYRPKLDA